MEYNSDVSTIYDIFGSCSGDFVELVEDMMDRVECDSEDELSDAVLSAIDNGLIYTSDEWTVLKHYCSPKDANWELAVSSFIDELTAYAYATCSFEEEEEEDEEEDLEEGCNSKKSKKMTEATQTVNNADKEALQLIVDYFDGKFDLDTLHTKLKRYFGNIKDAYNFLADHEDLARSISNGTAKVR